MLELGQKSESVDSAYAEQGEVPARTLPVSRG
jgi:hypothetical protein